MVIAGRDQAGIHVVGEEPVLHEGAGVEQLVDALPHRKLLHRPLALDALGAAHAVGPLTALRQVLDERLPVMELGGVSHQRPFQFGSRFSAKAAMPSAASSVMVLIVSIECR